MCWSAAASSTKVQLRSFGKISTCGAVFCGCEAMDKTVAVIGAGLIGRAWAMVFARGGWRVRLHDRDDAQLSAARAFIETSLAEQAGYGLVADCAGAVARIDSTRVLAEALSGVSWVQENLPEVVDVKREAFAALDRLAPPDAVLASSTSAI